MSHDFWWVPGHNASLGETPSLETASKIYEMKCIRRSNGSVYETRVELSPEETKTVKEQAKGKFNIGHS
jgi:hypothetical protein